MQKKKRYSKYARYKAESWVMRAIRIDFLSDAEVIEFYIKLLLVLKKNCTECKKVFM